jgi:hypothetical protein
MPILGASASGAKSSPVAPTIGTATDSGSGRAYNNGSATVTFTAPNSKLPITSYTVTSSTGSYTASGASSPLTVTGLQSATAYTFTVTATSAIGTSAASSASNSITATTVPQAPTIGTATNLGTGTTVSIAYTANATGGAAVSTFTATSSPGGLTNTGASPITVSGLTEGTAYTFTVTATNANGTSTASAASNSVTPVQVYAIGDTGKGGGKVFYDAGSTLSWGRYLEAATSSTSPAWSSDTSIPWAGTNSTNQSTIFFNSGTAAGIGTGMANTLCMLAQRNANDSSQTTASTVARAFTGGGFSNTSTGWFLPSKDEQAQLFAQRASIPGFTIDYYWSSTEQNGSGAWVQYWSAGNSVQGYSKSLNGRVRPIRAFS